MHFLKANLGQRILLSVDYDLQLYAWCESDWADCPLTIKSLTGWLILGNSPISWKTKKQHTMSHSFVEVEYRSMATTICKLK